MHRPRTLLSGLVFCGCCNGSYARRGQDRFACTNHVLGNGCDNARTIAREVLEARVLTGLHDRIMTPDMAAEAMRAYALETHRLNRERRSTAEATRRELAETAKAIAEIVRVIEQGGWHRALSDRLTELEKKQDGLTARLTEVPQDAPDIHPNIAETYRRRIERFTEALSHPDDALEAADAIREVIDRIVVTPGDSRGDYSITLQGELGTILDWIDRSGKPGYKPRSDTASSRLSVSVNGGASLKRLLSESDIAFLVDHGGEPPLWAIGATQRNSRIDHFLLGLGIREWGLSKFIEVLRKGAHDSSGPVKPDEKFLSWLKQKPAVWMQELYASLHAEAGSKTELLRTLIAGQVRQSATIGVPRSGLKWRTANDEDGQYVYAISLF